jgi:hypothetical protein
MHELRLRTQRVFGWHGWVRFHGTCPTMRYARRRN